MQTITKTQLVNAWNNPFQAAMFHKIKKQESFRSRPSYNFWLERKSFSSRVFIYSDDNWGICAYTHNLGCRDIESSYTIFF